MTKMGVLCLLAEGSRCPSLSCSLINSSKAVNFGSIMGHCSTLMSLSKNKERALRSGTRFPEGSGQAVAFRIGGVSLGQCASVREECPERPGMSWIMISSKEAQSLVRTTPISSNIFSPPKIAWDICHSGEKEPWLPSMPFQCTRRTTVRCSSVLPLH